VGCNEAKAEKMGVLRELAISWAANAVVLARG
jgi:hypothetical protein